MNLSDSFFFLLSLSKFNNRKFNYLLAFLRLNLYLNLLGIRNLNQLFCSKYLLLKLNRFNFRNFNFLCINLHFISNLQRLHNDLYRLEIWCLDELLNNLCRLIFIFSLYSFNSWYSNYFLNNLFLFLFLFLFRNSNRFDIRYFHVVLNI